MGGWTWPDAEDPGFGAEFVPASQAIPGAVDAARRLIQDGQPETFPADAYHRLKRGMAAREVLTDFMILTLEPNGLAAILQPGEVAGTIRVTTGLPNEGAFPGLRVSVLTTTTRTTPEEPSSVVTTILEGVEILAIEADGQAPKVTLRLKREQANRLDAAFEAGGVLRLEVPPREGMIREPALPVSPPRQQGLHARALAGAAGSPARRAPKGR